MANIEDLRIDQPVPRPQRRRPNFWPWVIIGGVIVAYFVLRGGVKLPSAAGMQQLVAGASEVEVFTIPSSNSGPPGSISAGGYLEVVPPGPAAVSALLAGQVTEVLAIPGQHVSKGDLVARLDASQLEQQTAVIRSDLQLAQTRLSRAKAGSRSQEIVGAEADLASAQAGLTKAEADYQRMKALYGKGIISASELEDVQRIYSQAQAEVDNKRAALELLNSGARSEDIAISQAEVAAVQARLTEIEWRIKQCSLHAPVAGTVYEQLAEIGDWLSPTDGNKDGASVLTIIDPAQIQAYVDVNQRDSTQISIGQRVELLTDAQPSRPVKGVVSRIMPRANLQKNTLQVKVRILEAPEDLRPEMSVKITFLPSDAPSDSEAPPPGVLVPASAVLDKDGARGVFVVALDKAAWRPIEDGGTEGSDIRALSGVAAGDQVILSPGGISDGQKIKLKSTEKKP